MAIKQQFNFSKWTFCEILGIKLPAQFKTSFIVHLALSLQFLKSAM